MRFPGFALAASTLWIWLAPGAARADGEAPDDAARGDFEVVVLRGASVYLVSREADGQVREVTLREDPHPASRETRPPPRPFVTPDPGVTVVIQNYPPESTFVGYAPTFSRHAGSFRHRARHTAHPSFFRHRVRHPAGPPPIYPVVFSRPSGAHKRHGGGSVRARF